MSMTVQPSMQMHTSQHVAGLHQYLNLSVSDLQIWRASLKPSLLMLFHSLVALTSKAALCVHLSADW